jgi:hypothetical protein
MKVLIILILMTLSFIPSIFSKTEYKRNRAATERIKPKRVDFREEREKEVRIKWFKFLEKRNIFFDVEKISTWQDEWEKLNQNFDYKKLTVKEKRFVREGFLSYVKDKYHLSMKEYRKVKLALERVRFER